ncbi:MAG: hypothetical protein BHW38_05320 [Firmicutes bacterium CAG:321_26_22]|nr:MAG: hypothetical protein BHW38_05320 [Firmicutes bacterium CAG:321_26_22]
MKNKIYISVMAVLIISALTFGATYAYYVSQDTKTFTGEIEKGIVSTLNLTTTKSSTNLVPLQDSKIKTAITKSSNKCIDKNNYEVCSLYTITLTNTNASENLYGYVKTNTTTYTTTNLKYQIFDSSYNAITDVMTISKTANDLVYFKKGTTQVSITSTGTKTYYLAIWLSDTNSDQSSDYSKTFNGAIGFELVGSPSDKLQATLS